MSLNVLRGALCGAAVLVASFTSSALFAGPMGMGMNAPAPATIATAYRFELAGPVQSRAGKSIVSVRLIDVAAKKPVVGAIFIHSRADMSPMGMAMMKAPIKALPTTTPGVYSFEIGNGSVWKKTDKWALTFSAKVQGEAETIRGSIIVELKP